MTLARKVLLGAAVLGMAVFLSGVSFADEGCHKGKMGMGHEAKIKLLQDSAAALQKSNPDLAKGLEDYAAKEAKESQDWKAQHDAKTKLLKDSAAALQKSNPDLAKGLDEMTEFKKKSEMNEKEEAGETVEPKSEQGEAK